ncbi:MAG: ABC transporter ATP-binding protein [Collinsella sp.]|nr:ABC transporter ATP-binding protein [Collinsella sp.]
MLSLLRRFGGVYRRHLIVGPLTKLVEVLFDLITPLVIARMIDEGITLRDTAVVVRYGAILIAMAVGGLLFTLICQKAAALASQGMGTDIRREMYHRINGFSYAELDRFGTPSLITRITNDVNQVQLAVALAIRQLIRWPLLAIGSMVAALTIDVRLGAIFLISTPLVGIVFWIVMARCVPYFKRMQSQLDRLALIAREGLEGARVVRAFAREGHERARFDDAARVQARIALAVGRLSSVLNPVTLLIMNLAVCAILWAGGLQVDAGDLTQGDVVAFVSYMTQTLLSIVYVANLVVIFTKASASASRIGEVLACEGAIADPVTPDPRIDDHILVRALAAIRFNGVSFSHEGASAPALDDVSLELPVGGTLGVIGGTGSGKSSLVQLIPRLYDVCSGSVEVLGVDVRSWPIARLRGEVSLVPQEASLVSGTIRSNLDWRDPDADDAELWDALETAQAADFVRALPGGLDARVEAGGRNFSGGQRQRLSIARALVGDPSVLILDDASSALDARTDSSLRRALRFRRQCGHGSPRSTVIVSQRVSSVRDADLICVMRHGRVVGLGGHEELIGTCAVYREICQSQHVEVAALGSGSEEGAVAHV